MIESFKASMRSAGLEPPEHIEPGRMHRFPGIGKRNGNTSGWCQLFPDGIGGVFGDWSTELSETWQAEREQPRTEAERAAFRQQIEQSRKQAEEQRQVEQQLSAARAMEILRGAVGDPIGHPYAMTKKVPFGGLVKRGPWRQRGWDDSLLVPIYNEHGQIVSVQAINPDGDKDFLAGGQKKGCFHPLGKLRGATGTILVGEGLATVAAAVSTTGLPGVVAFDAGNLPSVAEVVRRLAPGAEIVIVADDDMKDGTDHNTGIEAATRAALAVGGWLAVPGLGRKSDFWDLWSEQGPEAVRQAIANARAVQDGHVTVEAGPTPASEPPAEVQETVDAATTAGNIEAAKQVIKAATGKASSDTPDPGAVFESGVVEALRLLRRFDPAEFQRSRLAIKKASREIRISDLDEAVRGGEDAVEKEIAGTLVDMARRACTLFHCPDNDAYAVFEKAGHRECWRINGEGFSEWLCFQHYTERGRVPGDKPLKAALSTLTGVAKFEGQERPVYLRVANCDGAVWLDLCDSAWRAVSITSSGWTIHEKPPVMFTRTASMRSLPEPEPGGDLSPLWRIVNIPEDERLIVLAWLLECLRSETPYAVLELTGEEGSAKSSAQHYLREIIDPNRANLRAAPKAIEDVFISARNAHIVSYNNLSYVKPEYQDALCVLATGGGYAGRTLYTNGEETVIDLKKPVMLNGIATIVTAQDLLGRTVHIDLPAIERRLSEVEVKRSFEESKGGILGGLLDLFTAVLAILPGVAIPEDKRPRMADFAHLGEAVYRAYGRKAGEFLADYEEKRRDGVHRTLDASPVAVACLSYLDKNLCGYEGTVKGLYETVAPFRPEGEAWPRSPKGFADGLRRVAPALRLIGTNARISDRPGMHGYTCILKTATEYMSPGGESLETSSSCSSSSSKPGPALGPYEHDELHELKMGNIPHGNIYPPGQSGNIVTVEI